MINMDIKIKQYDAIVVYSESNANSARDKQYREKSPFSSNGSCGIYNDSYRYFLLRCKKMGIEVAFATSKDIIASGLFQSFWTYDKGWVRNYGKAYSRVIFDKFIPSSVKQKNKLKLLTSSKSIYIFNKELVKFFRNKLNTYILLKEFAIPTIKIKSLSKKNLYLAKNKLDKLLKNHKHKKDFFNNYLIKDESGEASNKIFKINFNNGLKEIKKEYELNKKNKSIAYILQPFINCDKGFVLGKYKGFMDFRVIIINQKIIQTYIRIARKGGFKCNGKEGDKLIHLPIKSIPTDVMIIVNKIKKIINNLKIKNHIYTLDFIKSNNKNVYLVEGNDKPGITWAFSRNNKSMTSKDKSINQQKTKELINLIVNELKLIIKERSIIHI